MLAAIVPSRVHQLDGVESAPTAPWGACRVRAGPAKREFGTDERHLPRLAPRDIEVAAHVREEHCIHILEHAVAHVVRFGADLLFGHTRPEMNGAGNAFALHDAL